MLDTLFLQVLLSRNICFFFDMQVLVNEVWNYDRVFISRSFVYLINMNFAYYCKGSPNVLNYRLSPPFNRLSLNEITSYILL